MIRSIISILLSSILIASFINPTRAQIAEDKELHFKAGLILSSLFYTIDTYGQDFDGERMSKVEYRHFRRKEALYWSIGITIAAGAAKELSDASGMGTPEWDDFLYTVYGGLAGSLLCLILDHLLSTSFDFVVDIPNQQLALKYKLK